MRAIQECREILEARGRTGVTDQAVEHLYYLLVKVADLHFRATYRAEMEVPPLPVALRRRRLSSPVAGGPGQSHAGGLPAAVTPPTR